MLDLYDILDVPQASSADEIKKAYHHLALIHHPDKNNGSQASTDKFKLIQAAYEVLGDVTKRNTYDATLSYGKTSAAKSGTCGATDYHARRRAQEQDELFAFVQYAREQVERLKAADERITKLERLYAERAKQERAAHLQHEEEQRKQEREDKQVEWVSLALLWAALAAGAYWLVEYSKRARGAYWDEEYTDYLRKEASKVPRPTKTFPVTYVPSNTEPSHGSRSDWQVVAFIFLCVILSVVTRMVGGLVRRKRS